MTRNTHFFLLTIALSILTLTYGCAATSNKTDQAILEALEKNNRFLENIAASQGVGTDTEPVGDVTPGSTEEGQPPADLQAMVEAAAGWQGGAGAPQTPAEPTQLTTEDRVGNLEVRMDIAEGQIATLEYGIGKLDRAVRKAGATNVINVEGVDVGDYAKGSAHVHHFMVNDIEAYVIEVKDYADALAKTKKLLILKVSLKSFTDRDGPEAINKKLRASRSKNVKKVMEKMFAKYGIEHVTFLIIPGEESTAAFTEAANRYTEIDVSFEEKDMS